MSETTLNLAPGQQLNGSYLIEKKFEIMLDSINKKFIGEINGLKEAVGALQQELRELKKQGSQQNYQQQNNHREERDASFSPVNPVRNAEEQKDSSVKPRYGDYNSKDVPIDKFFYFGNKKR